MSVRRVAVRRRSRQDSSAAGLVGLDARGDRRLVQGGPQLLELLRADQKREIPFLPSPIDRCRVAHLDQKRRKPGCWYRVPRASGFVGVAFRATFRANFAHGVVNEALQLAWVGIRSIGRSCSRGQFASRLPRGHRSQCPRWRNSKKRYGL